MGVDESDDRDGVSSCDVSPWATDDVPIVPPAEIVWSTRAEPNTASPASGDDGVQPNESNLPADSHRRGWFWRLRRIVVLGAVALLASSVLVVSFNRSDTPDSPAEDAAATTRLGPATTQNVSTPAGPTRPVPSCPDETAQICLADTASIGLDFDFGIDGLDLPTVERAETACAQGGDGSPDDPQVAWLLCAVLLDDGRQAVIGRANDPDLIVRTKLKQKTVEFPADTGPGQVIILNEPAPIFLLIDAAGETVGRFADPEPFRTQPD